MATTEIDKRLNPFYPWKFLSENFTIMLFHYDGNVDGWRDLEWSKKAIHIVAHNRTKCTSNIISLPIPLFHDKGLPYCRKRRKYWLLCWLCGGLIYDWASFMIRRALTSVAWGLVADRHGRKPVIIIGTFTVVIFNTLFGLSVNYWMAICTRFLLGSFNGLLGPIKAYACEIFNKEYRALGLSMVSTAWGI